MTRTTTSWSMGLSMSTSSVVSGSCAPWKMAAFMVAEYLRRNLMAAGGSVGRVNEVEDGRGEVQRALLGDVVAGSCDVAALVWPREVWVARGGRGKRVHAVVDTVDANARDGDRRLLREGSFDGLEGRIARRITVDADTTESPPRRSRDCRKPPRFVRRCPRRNSRSATRGATADGTRHSGWPPVRRGLARYESSTGTRAGAPGQVKRVGPTPRCSGGCSHPA